MKELADYSGPFRPDLKLTDFSKEALIKLIKFGGIIYGAVERCWYEAVAKRYGEGVADECRHEAWFRKGGAGDVENSQAQMLMNYKGDDIGTALKINQLLPAMATNMDLRFEKKGENHYVMSCYQCIVPESAAAHGKPEAGQKICEDLEAFGFQWSAKKYNPKIKVKALKFPPRKSKDEPHCVWEYTMEK